jgi:histidine ammonia-lyase
MAVEGAAKSARAVDCALELFTIELLVASQAVDLRGGITLGAGTTAAYACIRERAPQMVEDRLMANDISQVRGILDDGSLLRDVSAAISRPLGLGVSPLAGRGDL